MNNERGTVLGGAAERERRPIEVRNRDIPLLCDIPCIMQEIRQIEERREWQRDRMTNISQHLTGMPGGGGLPRGLDDAFARLAEIDEEHEMRCREYARQLRKAQTILNGLESRTMRVFVTMKYIMDVPDVSIRDALNMTRRGFDRARRAVEEAECMARVKWQERYIIAEEAKTD